MQDDQDHALHMQTNRPLSRATGISPPTSSGDLITADEKSRNDNRNALIVQDGYSYWIQSCPANSKPAAETNHVCRGSCFHPRSLGVQGDKSKDFIKARQELPWTERTTRTLFTAQEPMASTKELLEELKMEWQQRWVLPEEWWDCAVENMIPAERARHNCR